MINIDTVKNSLHARFGDFSEPKKDVFRVAQSYKDNVFSINYFDCSESFLFDKFDLDSYQDELLSDDYYKTSGSIQWNYYLHLVCTQDKYKELLESGELNLIERNRSYARKLVVTDKNLHNLVASFSDKAKDFGKAYFPDDPSAIWKSILIENDLQCVVDQNVPYNKVIEYYLNGYTQTSGLKADAQKKEKRHAIGLIRGVKINKFREYPKCENEPFEQEFGLVNLIDGVNGVGKTSLLESIEYWCCGITLRDPQRKDANSKYKIGIRFDGSSKYHPITSRRRDFQERNLEWYGSYQKQVDSLKLCLNFNRFNFFATDLAARMSLLESDENPSNIKSALAILLFGEDVNVLETRIEKSYNKFLVEERGLDKETARVRGLIDESEKTISQYGNGSVDEKGLLEDLIVDLKKSGWAGKDPANTRRSLNAVNRILANDLTTVDSILESLYWVRTATTGKLVHDYKQFLGARDDLDRLAEQQNAKMEEADRVKAWLADTRNVLKLLESYIRYVANVDIALIDTIESEMDILTRKIELRGLILDDLKGIDLQSRIGPQNVDTVIKSLETKLRNASNTKRALDDEISTIQEEEERIVALTTELREIAEEILSHDPSCESCPLCGTEYNHSELRKRVTRLKREYSENDELKKYIGDLARTNKNIKGIEGEIRCYKIIKSSIKRLRADEDEASLDMADIVEQLSKLPRILNEDKKLYENFVGIQKEFVRLELRKEEYNKLKRKIAGIEKSYAIDLSSLSSVKKQIARLMKKVASNENKLDSYERSIEDIELKRSSIVKNHLGRNPSIQSEHEFYERLEILEDSVGLIEQICGNYSLESSESIHQWRARLRRIKKLVENYIKTMDEVSEQKLVVREAKRKLSNYRAEYKGLSDRSKPIKHAITVLTEVMHKHSKHRYIEAFFKGNIEEIKDTFISIHAPNEFCDMRMIEGELVLIRESSKNSCTIDQISSGQRAALALSLFLTLNRKIKEGAPPFILFDDPIVFVDELNLLSFFDHLREISIGGHRQIFFATASSKISALFEKKFDFLGKENFKKIGLSR